MAEEQGLSGANLKLVKKVWPEVQNILWGRNATLLNRLLDAARSEGPLPVGGEEDHQALLTRLDTIRRTADHWREYDAANRAREDLTTTDDTHIIAPPCWPTHGMLKAWSETLALAMDRLTTPHHRAALYSQRRSK